MDLMLLDFSLCTQASKCTKGEFCICFDLKNGSCRRCGKVCDVYMKYLTQKGTAADLMEFWANRHSQGQSHSKNTI